MTDSERAAVIQDMCRRGATISALKCSVESIRRDERAAAMAAILDGCPSDGSDAEIILRRAWDRVRTMRSNVKVRGCGDD